MNTVTFEGSGKIVMEMKAEATVKKAYTFTIGGTEIGSVDAAYDFTNLPKPLHPIATQMLSHNNSTVMLCKEILPDRAWDEMGIKFSVKEPPKLDRKKPWYQFW